MVCFKKQTGSSAVEIFISMLVFVPFFIAIPLLGKYSDIRHKTLEASRYSVWERTVHAQSNNAWRDGDGEFSEAFKTPEQIYLEADRRFFGNQKVGMHQASSQSDQTVSHFWKNRKGESLLKGVGANSTAKLSGSMAHLDMSDQIDLLSSIGGGVAGVEFIANRGLSQYIGGIGNVNIDLGAVVGGCDIPGVNLGSGLDLGRRGFATSNISVPVTDFMQRTQGEQKDMVYQENAAILSNSWAAPTDRKYQERIDNLTPNQFVNCLTGAGDFFYGLPVLNILYGEVRDSYRSDIGSPSDVLPNDLIVLDEFPEN